LRNRCERALERVEYQDASARPKRLADTTFTKNEVENTQGPHSQRRGVTRACFEYRVSVKGIRRLKGLVAEKRVLHTGGRGAVRKSGR